MSYAPKYPGPDEPNWNVLFRVLMCALIAGLVAISLIATTARGQDYIEEPQRPDVLRVGTGCSGVQVGPELAVTAKHCGDDLSPHGTTKIRTEDGQESFALHLLDIGESDGPSVYRTGRRSQWLPVSDAPPPVGSGITLWGHEPQMKARGKVLGVETVVIRQGEKAVEVEQNRTSALARPGFSGGPGVVDGEHTVSGLVLSGDKTSTGITTWQSLRATVATAERLLQAQPACTVYVTRRCAACDTFKRDLERGAYVRLPVSFVLVYIDQQSVPGVDVAPTFELNGQRWTPEKYDGKEIAGWIRAQLQAPTAIVQPTYWPPPGATPPSPYPTDPSYDRVAVPPVEMGVEIAAPAAPAIAIPWHGIRIIAIASEDCPVYAPYLAGPFNRVLSMASGGQTALETVSEISEPVRYRSVTQAAGIWELRPALYVIVLVDAVAEVGFVRGMILQQIERAVDEAVKGEKLRIPVDAVFARAHRHNYDAITRAMQVDDPGGATHRGRATTHAVVANQDGEDEAPADDEEQSSPIAFILGLLGVTGARRVWKFYSDSWHQSAAEKQMQMSETMRSAGAAPPAAAAPAGPRPAAAPAAAVK